MLCLITCNLNFLKLCLRDRKRIYSRCQNQLLEVRSPRQSRFNIGFDFIKFRWKILSFEIWSYKALLNVVEVASSTIPYISFLYYFLSHFETKFMASNYMAAKNQIFIETKNEKWNQIFICENLIVFSLHDDIIELVFPSYVIHGK